MKAPPTRPTFVVDTSVVLKWFVEKEEAGVAPARQLREAYVSGRCGLSAPEILLVETANALTVGRRASVSEVVQALKAIGEIQLHLIRLRLPTLVQAVELASTYGVTVYDSCFLAVAIESGSVLVTADDVFIRRVGRHPAVTSLGLLGLSY